MERDLESLRALLADRYRIDGELGRGGYAVVYRARNLRLERAEALKVDLLVLEHEYHVGAGQGFATSVAEQVIRQHPTLSILLAKPPA